MKAIEITQYGAPEVLRAGERPDPSAGPGELLIRVAASGVNRPDVLQRTGNYPVPPGASDIPGLEVAGTIVSGDAKAMQEAGLKVGDRTLMASDGMAREAPVFRGFSLSLTVADEADAKRKFEALGEGGEVRMPLAPTFFSPSFGMVQDRFGVGWMVIVQK